MTNREKILALLRAHIAQRPGLEFANYGDVSAYRSEMRGITQDRHDAEMMLRQVELMESSIPEDKLREAFRAFSGRLTLTDMPDGRIRLDYCTGQYFPTEYRRAACAVLASALWDAKSSNMPPIAGYQVKAWHGSEPFRAPIFTHRGMADNYLSANGGSQRGHVVELFAAGQSAGDWMRAQFRREFGRRIANRYFN